MDELDIFIGGQWRRGGNLMHSQFPADGAINAALYAASLDDLQEAIDRADRAWRGANVAGDAAASAGEDPA